MKQKGLKMAIRILGGYKWTAREVGVSPYTVLGWSCGRSKPKQDFKEKLIKSLNQIPGINFTVNDLNHLGD